jgi:hypothetical protein
LSKSSGVTPQERLDLGDPGVRHHHVEATELVDHPANHPLDLARIRDVRDDRRHAPVGAKDLLSHAL